MKNSGVEWIGDIPSHWEIISGTVLGDYSKGKGIKKDEIVEKGLPCIRYGEIYTTYEHSFKETVSFIPPEIVEKTISVNTGTILLTGSGETVEDIGKCVVYLGKPEIYVGGDIIVLELTNKFFPSFISYLINSESVRIQREVSGRGDIIVHIYSKNFKEMKFPIPPYDEQSKIVEFIDSETKTIDKTMSLEEKKINLLKEYKQSLISEVVTGKINVQEEIEEVMV